MRWILIAICSFLTIVSGVACGKSCSCEELEGCKLSLLVRDVKEAMASIRESGSLRPEDRILMLRLIKQEKGISRLLAADLISQAWRSVPLEREYHKSVLEQLRDGASQEDERAYWNRYISALDSSAVGGEQGSKGQ
ncbi:MAG TPA: hypothetical protein PKA27_17280 [Fimbriimonadaceae bacterium]|nr:hypothetical protein [Fimbriimonadaceae bacterium]